MNIFKQALNIYTQKFLSHPDMRVKLFNILATGGIASCVSVILYELYHFHTGKLITNTLLLLISLALLIYSQRTGNYQRCYLITIICIFLIGFPVLFFMNGGYLGGMPTFFVFAIMFTILMLDKKTALIIAPIELCVYISLCYIAYKHPETIQFFDTEFDIMLDTVLALTLSSVICGICIYLHLREYDAQQETLALQNAQLKRYNEAKSTFLTTVAHEIRNPLTAISANARDTRELLEEQEQEPELMNNNLETVEKIVLRIDRILTDLMDTVSIEQGRFQLQMAPVSLEAILQEAIRHYKPEIKNSRNAISLDIDSLTPIMADHERLLQVMVNLLSNSLKYTKNGYIKLSLKEDATHQIVAVADSGDGMAKKIRNEVFKGYVSMSKEYWRHGIGLYVCHQIITAHEGTIAVESEIGKGTKITFRLPKNIY